MFHALHDEDFQLFLMKSRASFYESGQNHTALLLPTAEQQLRDLGKLSLLSAEL